MDPLFGGMLSGGLGLIGSIFGTSQNNKNAQEMQAQAQSFNAAQAQMNRDFQQQMSSTAYQRASADMTAAGLNPAAMFGSGSAASTPSGSTAAASQPATKTSALTSIGPAMDRVVSSAVSAKTFDKMTEEIANLRANEAFTQARTTSEKEEPALKKAQAYSTREHGTQATVQAQGTRSENVAKEKEAQYILDHPWINEGAFLGRKWGQIVAPAGDLVNSAGSAVRALRDVGSVIRDPKRVWDRFPDRREGYRAY